MYLEQIIAAIVRVVLETVFGAARQRRLDAERSAADKQAGAQESANSINQETIDAMDRISKAELAPTDDRQLAADLASGKLKL